MNRWPLCMVLTFFAIADRDGGQRKSSSDGSVHFPKPQTTSSLLSQNLLLIQKKKNVNLWPPNASSGKFDAWELDYMTDSSGSAGKESSYDLLAAAVAADNGQTGGSGSSGMSDDSLGTGAEDHGDIVRSSTSTVTENKNGTKTTVTERTIQYGDGTVEKKRILNTNGSFENSTGITSVGSPSAFGGPGAFGGNGSSNENSSCVTREEPRASVLGYTTAEPGTLCVFGVDDRDEGFHCIMDDEKYGSFGWCYTSKDADAWGSCSESCPLFGPPKILAAKIEKLRNTMHTDHDEISAKVDNLSSAIDNLTAMMNNTSNGTNGTMNSSAAR